MTELLSREINLRSLNDQLNKMSSSTAHEKTAASPRARGGGSSGAKVDHRYHTYTKSKGPSTLLKKRGGGDGGYETASDVSSKERNIHSSNTSRKTRVGGKATSNMSSNSPAAPKHASRTDDVNNSVATTEANRKEASTASEKIGSRTSTSTRKNTKSPDGSTRTFSRTSTQRISSNNNATFTVRYRNPKFVESPSLEVLVRDESAAIRQKSNSTSPSPDMDNATTLTKVNSTARKHISTDGLIKFLKSKISILEEDHERLTHEMSHQKELLEKTLERHRKVEQQRDQAYSKHNALNDQITKMEAQLEEANRRVKERMMEQTCQQKELETVKREVKVLTVANTNLEKRLYRANEELESAKNALTMMKTAERDFKETMRIENEGKDKQIKSLKKQRADLLNAYKKQLFLIDNLKRQNVCLEQTKVINFAEKEFNKVLEWNTKT